MVSAVSDTEAGNALSPAMSVSMVGLMLHGALGRLGEAAGVAGFEFQHRVVKPTLAPGRREVVVVFAGCSGQP